MTAPLPRRAGASPGSPPPGSALLRIDLIDPLGRTAEWSRYAATTAGAGGGGAQAQRTFRVE